MAEQELVGSGVAARATWSSVENVRGRGEGVRPERGWDSGVEKEGTNAVIQCAQDTLGATILL